MNSLECEVCDGKGYYYDRRCLAKDDCDHQGKLVSFKQEDGSYKRKRVKIMECPKRPCPSPCLFGIVERGKLSRRIEKQNRLIRKYEKQIQLYNA